jgi:hypothetical protein
MRTDPTEILQPSIFIGNLEIGEPVTMITDLMIAACAFYAWWKLKARAHEGKVFVFFRWFFLLTAIGTAMGGILGHGFLYAINDNWKLLGFYVGMFAVVAIERSSIIHALPLINPKLGKAFLVINALELIIMMIYTALTLHFKFVEYHIAYGFLGVVFGFHLFVYLKTKDAGSQIILWNTLFLLITVFIFNYPIIIHEWFNHRDFAHIFMAITQLVLLRAAFRLGYKKEGTPIPETGAMQRL